MKKILVFITVLFCLFSFSACMGDMSIYTKSEQDEYMTDAIFSSKQKVDHKMSLYDITYNDWFGNEKIILNFSKGKTDKECIPSYSITYDESTLTFMITLENVSAEEFSPVGDAKLASVASVEYNTNDKNQFVISMKLNNKVKYRVDETKEYSMLVVCLAKK